MKNLSKYSLILCILSVLFSAWYYPKWQNKGTEATISWDVAGYYYYLPAFFIYKDAKKLKFKDDITKKYKPSGSFYQAYEHESGNYVMKYSAGQAVMMSPFFFIGHAAASFTEYPADGFSRPYQKAIHWGSLFIACLGLFYSRKNLLEYFDDDVIALALIFVTVGTNYLAYAAHNSAMTHNYLFTVLAIFIWNTIQWHKRPNFKNAAVLGVCLGLAALTRPPEIIYAILPLLWGVSFNKSSVLERIQFLREHWKYLTLAAVITILIGSIQIIYWLYATGEPIVYSYKEQGFDWLNPHISDVLFSYRKGWLLYTPLMIFGVLGLYHLWKQKKSIFLSIFLFNLVNFYIVSAWSIWWYGGSFGQRAMIQSYAVWLFPFAAFIYWILKKDWRKWVFFPLFTFFMTLNIFHTRGPLDPEIMNKAFYWKSFFNFDVSDHDRLLLDSNEYNIQKRNNVKSILKDDLETFDISEKGVSFFQKDSTNKVFFVDKQIEVSPFIFADKTDLGETKWLRIGANFLMPEKEWFYWTMPQFVVMFLDEGRQIEYMMIRPARILKNNEWNAAWIDCKMPKQDFDKIKIYLWNANGNKTLFMDDVYVETFE